MSQVWLMRPEMPVPEPPPRTAMAAPGVLPMYSSAKIWTRLTMVSEPLIWIIFRAGAAGRTTARRASIARAMSVIFFIFILLGGLSWTGSEGQEERQVEDDVAVRGGRGLV